MELKRLNSDVISKIRSAFNVSNVAQCVFELVCNSLDAKASSVAVRVNLISFKIQIADNGEGITKENMELIGLRYMTNKCRTLKEFQKQLRTYGYRGESLASIIENSIKVSISSRSTGSSETFVKTMGKDVNIEVKTTKFRPSIGTTVTVFGFMSNIPVRQKRVIDEIELEGVKKCLENLIIINPMTSFSLRNDATGLLLLKSPKNVDIIGSFRSLHQDINDSFELLKVSKHKVTIEGLFHKDFSLSKKYQYIYVNKRPVNSPKLQNHILKLFQKKYFAQNHPIFETKKYPMYVFHIRCPSSFLDILSNSIKSEVEFQSWDVIMACTDKILNTFLGSNEQKIEKMSLYSPEEVSCGVSKVFGAVQGRAVKRKCDEAFEKDSNMKKDKNSKIQEVLSPGTDPTQTYEIYDSGKDLVKPSKHKKIVSILRKPLEIKVNRESKIKKQKFNIEMDLNQPHHSSEGLDRELLYSKPNSNEIQGKNFLLDKFLRSAQISNEYEQGSEVNYPDVSSETILESNFVMEKDVKDHFKGINTTMSININMKKKKLKEKYKAHVQTPYVRRTNSGVSELSGKLENINLEDPGIKKKPKSNYTIVMNTSKTKTLYKFVKKTESLEVQTSSNEATAPKICTCYMKKGKFFEFPNSTQKSLKEISNNYDLEVFKKPLDPNKNKEDLNSLEQFEVCESPYFTEISKNTTVVQKNRHDKTNNSKQTLSHSTVYDKFQPKFNSTQFSTDVVYSSVNNITPKSNSIFFRDNNNNDDIVVKSMPNVRPNMHFSVKDACLKPNCCCSNYLPSKQEILNTIAQNIEAVNENIKNDLLDINKKQIIEESLPLNPNFSSQIVYTPQNNNVVEESHRKSEEKSPEEDDFRFQFSNDLFTEVSSFKGSPNIPIIPNNENLFKNLNNQVQAVKNSGKIKNSQTKPSTFKFQFSNEVLSRNFPTQNDPPKKTGNFFELDEAIAPTKSYFEDSCLVITLPETNEKKKMFEDLLNEARREQNQNTCNSGEYPEFESGKVVMDSQNVWIKCYNDAGGKYYTNKRTGMVSKTTPKLMEKDFSFGSRLGFVPKGLSPVLKGHLPVNKVMSQKSKNKLQEFILESYENELLVVKWQNYISDDPVEFFNEIYREKAKTIENGITSLQNNAFKKWRNEVNFKQEMLSDLEILGQADKKFIVAVHKTEKLLVLFDQHAVHERIRLESILKEYKGRKSKCKENLTFFLPRNDLSLLKKHTSYLSSLGLDVRFFTDGLSLLNIPLCIQEKYPSDCKEDLNKILLTLINDILEFLKQARCSTSKLPKIIQNLLNLKACRGAIKFGDCLSKEECEDLLKKLKLCKLPFQCAHGRPTMQPVLHLDKVLPFTSKAKPINLRKLL